METNVQSLTQTKKIVLIAAIIMGVVLRLWVVSQASTDPYYLGGGDSLWYIVNGMGLMSGDASGEYYGMPFQNSALPTAPLYLIFLGVWFQSLPVVAAFTMVRLLQVVINLLMIYLAYRITKRLSQSVHAAWVLAIALLLAPPLIIEPAEILTETLYMGFIVAGLWAYLGAVDERLSWRYLVLSAVLFALASLTRAVSLAFPIALAGLMIFIIPRKTWLQALTPAIAFLLIYAIGVGSWTAYNVLVYQRVVIASDQLAPAIWRGASTEDGSPRQNDDLLGEQTAAEQATDIILSDPMSYIVRRTTELAGSYLQPHGTINLGNQSLRALVAEWVNDGLSWAGFVRLINGEGFWIKLVFYIWHFGALLFGLIGMWLTRKQWRISLALIGFIAYTTLVHWLTLDLPRYLFPMYPMYWIFAAIAIHALWIRLTKTGELDGLSQ